jgi:hypothetical protein
MGFGNDLDAYAKTLFETAVAEQVKAIGITDYFCIDGYKALRTLVDDTARLVALVGEEIAERARRILLIPNIEFRGLPVVKTGSGETGRINYHVLISNEIDPTIIEEQFLHDLHFTAIARADHPDEQWPLKISNLTELGRKLKKEHDQFANKGDLQVGMEQAVVDPTEAMKVLSQRRWHFQDRYVFAVPADEDLSELDWNSQEHQTRKTYLAKAHMVFSGNPGTRDFALGKRHESIEAFRDEFGEPKPCVHGSDAHRYESLFRPAKDRYLWIKGDLTFQGLRQLLFEPADRVYIGEHPPQLAQVRNNSTKYMVEVGFARTQYAKDSEKWFSGRIPLNHGLIAIIGNKGSGKSALADVLGLLGRTTASGHFSFLRESRFLNPKADLGKMFQSTVVWASGDSVAERLDKPVDKTAPELVKYIPQRYLEEICAELKESSDTRFDRELMEVIFSHVDEADRLGKENLGDLIDYVSETKRQRIGQLEAETSDINGTIVDLEAQATDEYRQRIEAQLAQRKAELSAHEKAKPAEVKEPTKDPEAQEAATLLAQELTSLQTELNELDKALLKERDSLTAATRQVASADRLLTRIDNLERALASFYEESTEDAEALGINVRDLVELHIERHPIDAVRAQALELKASNQAAMNDQEEGSVASNRNGAASQLEEKRAQLDEPNRRYQAYLQELAAWDAKRVEIEGSATTSGSVKGLEKLLHSLANLPDRLSEQRKRRMTLTRQIFDVKHQLLADFRRLYSPVQQFIDEHPVSQQHRALEFSAAIAEAGFVDGLLDHIHQGRKGSFQHEVEGRERARKLALAADFSTGDSVELFTSAIQDHLERDHGDEKLSAVHVQDQLRQDFSVQELYDFIYGLSYLEPRFALEWQGKPIAHLAWLQSSPCIVTSTVAAARCQARHLTTARCCNIDYSPGPDAGLPCVHGNHGRVRSTVSLERIGPDRVEHLIVRAIVDARFVDRVLSYNTGTPAGRSVNGDSLVTVSATHSARLSHGGAVGGNGVGTWMLVIGVHPG